MKEELLQFIWQQQYFNRLELLSEDGETLQILSPGDLNTHQGPDFLNAQVRIGHTLLAGAVELHILASDWRRHAHSGDQHYRNVILHVVWENDLSPGGTVGKHLPAENFPMLVLQHRVPKLLLGQYEKRMKSPVFIPCERVTATVAPQILAAWRQQLLLRRLGRRALLIRSFLQQNRQDWEETAWWLMARNFGLPLNGLAFETLGKTLPVRLLARHKGDAFRLEALLLGQAGLLEKDFRSDYPQRLQKEYNYLQKKYHLSPISIPLSFLRMRPAHFPTIRLVQLAALLSEHTAWFAAIRAADSPRDFASWLQVEATGYWDDHYLLEASGIAAGREPLSTKDRLRAGSVKPGPKKLGNSMRNSLLINTFVPLLYTYGVLRGEPACQDRALHWLQEAAAERNSILAGWEKIGITNKNAADSQALLELKTHYCGPKKCLDCAIGQVLLPRFRQE